MHRFYLSPECCRGNALRLAGREAHHALHVLRLQRGERVSVLDGGGGECLCTVENAAKDFLTLTVEARKIMPAPACAITLLVAIPKGKLIESIIPKAVELGASRIVPLLTDRVITQLDDAGAESKREKWQQVAIEAIKQCGAVWLPKVEAPMTIAAFLARGENIELPFIGSLQTARRHPRVWIQEFQRQHGRLPHHAAVWIGPEGDFTLAELQQIEAAGARPITLGSLTLRVETAAIYCLAFMNYELLSQMSEPT
jgi:16S rRNA (uracil1498-N3)-methyltransferase